ncbi:hypothetical protein FNF27_03830 [Cafeteria roenbergensis]|uniref:Elongator complex protein 2 n=1 Tax=Cafeteria roenbergensis TaxID=33653 RepID=A0A5A8ED73_CAFRO|nr:hypothetical protein FNF27_03830 [Cafeteria roenbergensis]
MDAAPLADATTVEYLSCGPNTASGAADWSAARHSAFADHESGLLLAACGPFVAVNDIVGGRTIQLASAHAQDVQSVRWTRRSGASPDAPETGAVSSCRGGLAVLWAARSAAPAAAAHRQDLLRARRRLRMPPRAVPWEAAGGGVAPSASAATGPKWASAPISGVAALDNADESATTVFGVSSEGQLALWTVPADRLDADADVACPDEALPPGHVAELAPTSIALCCEIAPAPHAAGSGSAGILCFSGGVDGALRVWAPVGGGRLACLSSSTGSSDWVRGVRASGGHAGSDLVVATASNDGRLRLWSLEAGRASSGPDAAAAAAAAAAALQERKEEDAAADDDDDEGPSLALGQVNRPQLVKLPGTAEAAADASMLVTAGEDSSLLLWQRVDGEWGPVVRLAGSTGRQLPLLAAGVHGHSLACLAVASPHAPAAGGASSAAAAAGSGDGATLPLSPAECLAEHRLFSGGEEKVIRVFDAPCRFLETRDGICGTAGDAEAAARWQRAALHVGERAFRPELGLSNKAAGHGAASIAVAGTVDASGAAGEPGADGAAGVVDAPNRPDGHAPAGLVTVANTAAERLKLEQAIKDAARADAAAVHDGAAAAAKAAPSAPPKAAPQPSAPAGSRPLTAVPLPGGGGATSWAPSVKDLFGAQLGTQEGMAAAPGGAPLDGDLACETLWPEVNKLYGHGDALVALAAHPGGNIIASSSLARTTEQARIRLWSAADGAPVAVLEAHESTAIGLAFSPCGSLLASVSRDRHLCLFRRLRAGEASAAHAPWQLLARVKAHRRMAWCVAFAPATSLDETLLVTGGREGAVIAWRLSGNPAAADASALKLAREKPVVEKTGAAVTALAFAPFLGSDAPPVLAVGLETGRIALFAGRGAGEAWAPLGRLPGSASHQGAVRALAWTLAGCALGTARLATAGDDGSARVCVVDVRAALARAGLTTRE